MREGELSRRGFLGMVGAAGAVGTAGCAALEPPGSPGSAIVERTGDGRFVELYEAISPAVVEVHIPGPTEPFEPMGGSGFVMQDTGIVTNAHVVTDVPRVELRFHNREWIEADVMETDPHSDLAVVDASGVPDDITSIPFEDSVPAIGEEVMVIGAPLGLGGSASTGIVSGVGRVLPSITGFSIPAAIQTDAAVNPGNSGGPLVDLEGNVVGVVFAGASENIGFAISGPLATRVLPVLADGEAYEHAYFGVVLADVGPRIASANNLSEPEGVYVNDVAPNTPADGVLRGSTDITTVDGQQVPVGGDVIVAIDGAPTQHLEAFQSYVALETAPEESVAIDLIRDGARETVNMTLGTRPDSPMELDP